MKYWQTEHFKALQKAWYERLQGEGFKDEEVIIGVCLKLKQYRYPQINEDIEGYYIVINDRVESASFDSEIEKVVMTLHARGARHREIGRELKKMNHGHSRYTVWSIIRKYEARWGIKTLPPCLQKIF